MDIDTEQGRDIDEDRDIDRYKEFIVHLRRVNQRFQKQCEAPMGEITSLLTIQHMCKKDDQISVSGLGEKLRLSRPAVSRMIHTLKRKGYIEFYSGKKDHRYLYITLTERGKELICKEMGRCMSLIRSVSEKMGSEDMDRFLYYNKKFFSLLAEEKLESGSLTD